MEHMDAMRTHYNLIRKAGKGGLARGGTMFTPSFLRNQQFALTGKTSANAYKAEMSLVRIESQLESSEMGTALSQSIARLEAISTVRIDGLSPSMRELVLMDALGIESVENLYRCRNLETNFCQRNASIEAFHYLDTLRWIARTVTPRYRFTPQFILDVHSRCLYGKEALETGVRFRENEFDYDSSDRTSYSLRPPAAAEVPEYIEDICEFMNSGYFSPIVQTGFMHFQFEGIKPFKTALDRTGRALCHALFYARGLVKDVITPIALLPAIDTTSHVRHLLPYSFGILEDNSAAGLAIDSWTNFCAISLAAAVRVTSSYNDAFTKLVTRWRKQVGKISAGSSMEMILNILPGYPYVTANLACELTGRGFSSANDAVNRLVDSGVLLQVENGLTSSRMFEARGAFDIIDKIDGNLLSDRPVSRESLAGR